MDYRFWEKKNVGRQLSGDRYLERKTERECRITLSRKLREGPETGEKMSVKGGSTKIKSQGRLNRRFKPQKIVCSIALQYLIEHLQTVVLRKGLVVVHDR